MGGLAQAQILSEVVLRLFGGATAQEAVSAPRWVVGGMELGQPTTVGYLESHLGSDVQASIAARMSVSMLGAVDDSVGHSQAVAVGEDGALSAGSDPRSDGRASLYP